MLLMIASSLRGQYQRAEVALLAWCCPDRPDAIARDVAKAHVDDFVQPLPGEQQKLH
jgi:hypothetical protein